MRWRPEQELMMQTHSKPSTIRHAGLAGLFAALALGACAPRSTSPEQVQASNPTVTYKYHSDQELVQANQNAAVFCSRYQAGPRASSMAPDRDGSKVVIFECVPAPAVAQAVPVTQPYNPTITYNFRTDQDLVDGSLSAQTYCRNNGSQLFTSNIVNNTNGTKTATFQCGPR